MSPVSYSSGQVTPTPNQRVLFVLLPAVHGARQEEVIDHRLTDREWAEEWKHLDNVCIRVIAIC